MLYHVFRTAFCPNIKSTKKLLTVSEIQKCATINLCSGKELPTAREIVSDDMLKKGPVPVNPSVQVQLELAVKYSKKLEELLKSEDQRKLYKMVEVEVNVARAQGMLIPEVMTSKHWLNLLGLTNYAKRRKYLSFLRLGEIKEANAKAKKQNKVEERLSRIKEMDEQPGMKYGLHNNTMFLRMYKQTMTKFYDKKLLSAIQFAPKVVFDFSFEEYMTQCEWTYCARQLALAYSDNRRHREPFNLYFCNAEKNDQVVEALRSRIPFLLDDTFLVNMTSKCYTEIFDKKELVYLTPHCRTVMHEFNPNFVYVIGAIVDKHKPLPITLAKAKQQNIRMMKLPLDEYLDWGAGSTKNLTINQVLNILLDISYTNDWNEAFKHVPRRKLLEATKDRILRKLKDPETVFNKLKRRNNRISSMEAFN